MKKQVLVLIVMMSAWTAVAQNDKVKIGGDISANWGQLNDHIEISPYVLRQIRSNLYLGVGATGALYRTQSEGSYVDNGQEYPFESTTNSAFFGGSAMAHFFPFANSEETISQNIFLLSEFEVLRGRSKYEDDYVSQTDKDTYKTPFLGLGYQHPIGKKLNLNTIVKAKLNDEENSPYKRLSLNLGLSF